MCKAGFYCPAEVRIKNNKYSFPLDNSGYVILTNSYDFIKDLKSISCP